MNEDTQWDRPTTFSLNEKKKKTFLLITAIVFILGVGLIIAGSIMLGIGVSKNNKGNKVCDQTIPNPLYITVQSDILYSQIENNYESSVNKIKDQIQSALGKSNGISPIVTILGLSLDSDGQHTIAIAGIIFAYNNRQSTNDVQKKIQSSSNLKLYQIEDDKGSTTMNNQLCTLVNAYNGTQITTTPQYSTSTTPSPTLLPSSTYKDIFILIDDSNMVQNENNHNSIINWIVQDLISNWKIGNQSFEVAPVFYSKYEYNSLFDFDANDMTELASALTQSTYSGRYDASLTRALKMTSRYPNRIGVGRTVILISASSNSSDIKDALKYSDMLKQADVEIITVGVNNVDAKSLGQLSSGASYSFKSDTFQISHDIALQINAMIVEGAPTSTTISTTEASTNASTAASTAASTDASTAASTEASTVASTAASTDASTAASTEASTDASTAASTEASTDASTEASTDASTASSTVAPITVTVPKTTVSPVVQQSCPRDIIILLDDSNAFIDRLNFFNMKEWLINELIARLNFGEESLRCRIFAYSNESVTDIASDFDVESTKEIQILLYDKYDFLIDNTPNIERILRKVETILSPRGQPTIVLLSASDKTDDVNAAMKYSNSMKSKGSTFITLGVGTQITNNLEKLSSGAGFTFNTDSYIFSSDITDQIAHSICSTATTLSTTPLTTEVPSTTTSNPGVSFPCNPDVGLLIDSSSQSQSASDYRNLNDFISGSLVINWDVNRHATEAVVISANDQAAEIAPKKYLYQSGEELSEAVSSLHSSNYGGNTRITTLLSLLGNTEHERRQSQPLTAIIFTHYTNPDDITSALETIKDKDINIIAVGIGNEASASELQRLTGNVITVPTLSVAVKPMIESLVCTKSPALTTTAQTTTILTTTIQTTTQTVATTTEKPTTTTQATTSTIPPTTPIPQCLDCYPDISNIQILLDTSISQNKQIFDQQKQAAMSLVSNWNYMNRIALAAYAQQFDPLIPYDTLRNDEVDTLKQLILTLTQSNTKANLTNCLSKANNIDNSNKYGKQHTILFTMSSDPDDITKALQAAQSLRQKGSVTVVGVNIPNVSDLTKLSLPNDAIAWTKLDDIDDVVRRIMITLPHTHNPVTHTESIPSTPTTMQMTTTVITTVKPIDYSPDKSNILLVLDASAEQDDDTFDNQKKAAIELISSWTHFERFSFGTFSNTFIQTILYNEYHTLEDVKADIEICTISESNSNITKALTDINQMVTPIEEYGKQHTILFVSTIKQADFLQKTYDMGNELNNKGSLITIGVQAEDVTALQGLSSIPPIMWADSTKSDTLINDIMADLSSTPVSTSSIAPTQSTTPVPTSSLAPTESTTPVPTSSLAPTESTTPVPTSSLAPTESTTPVPTSSLAPTESTTPVPTSSLAPTESSTPVPTSTVAPKQFIPEKSNVLLIMDCSSNNQNQNKNDKVIETMKNLVKTWNHMERISLACFSNDLTLVKQYLDITDISSLNQAIDQLHGTQINADIKKMFETASKISFDKEKYGKQHTIIFTFSSGTDDAQQFAGELMAEGSTTIIGVDMTDITSLIPLATKNSCFSWDSSSSSSDLINNIMNVLK